MLTTPPPLRRNRARTIIARQTRHLAHMVDDLLDVSRVTRGLVALSTQVLDVRRVVDDAAEPTSEEPGRPAAPAEELGATAAISHLGRSRADSHGAAPTASPQPDGDRR